MSFLIKKKNFYGQKGPTGYVPGIGRGATGFITRSDIGAARETGEVFLERNYYAQKRKKENEAAKEEDDHEDLNDANFDEFNGYSGSLFTTGPYEKDDEEADHIYETVDRRMDERRREKREEKLKKQVEDFRKKRPKIQQQFADLKRKLATVSTAEWDAIPEVGDARNKTQRNPLAERFTPIPDSIIAGNLIRTKNLTTIDDQGTVSGLVSGLASAGPVDLVKIGEARKSLVGVRLDQASDSVAGQTVVDPKGYLTGLQSVTPQFSGDIGDIKKARKLLSSVTSANPTHGQGWIAAARLEEVTGQLAKAQTIIMKGTQECPNSEDVWLEAVRLQPADTARSIVALALGSNPTSVNLWLKAIELEKSDVAAQRRISRKALERVANSVRLWKAAVELEEPEDARILLGRAVECCTHSVELWLALARLEDYQEARRVLNKAREMIPTDRTIWITAAKLEEVNENTGMVEKIIERAFRSLRSNEVEINRLIWLEDAEEAERGNYIITARAIVKYVLSIGVEPEDRKRVWLADAENLIQKESYHCARAVFAAALVELPMKKSIWRKAAFFEKNHGSKETLESLLKSAVENCPRNQLFWLMLAKSKWLSGDVDEARKILAQAFEAIPYDEEIWLAAVKVESMSDQFERARKLLKKARDSAATSRIFMKYARLEWTLGNTQIALNLVDEGINKFPDFAKFYMMKGQLLEQMEQKTQAYEAYLKGSKVCSSSIPIWILLAEVCEEIFDVTKARSVLEQGRHKNFANPELWVASIRFESRIGNHEFSKKLLSRALQECPTNGKLWAEAIFMENRHQRKTLSIEALKKCENDANVLLAVSILFWSERKVVKARQWFTRVVKVDPDFGDGWAYYLKFERQFGTDEQQKNIIDRCCIAEPHHGENWCIISKSIQNWKAKTQDLIFIVSDALKPVDLL